MDRNDNYSEYDYQFKPLEEVSDESHLLETYTFEVLDSPQVHYCLLVYEDRNHPQ